MGGVGGGGDVTKDRLGQGQGVQHVNIDIVSFIVSGTSPINSCMICLGW